MNENTSVRERISALTEQAIESRRYIIGVWRIEPDPVPGNLDRIFMELDVQRWPTSDFLPVVDLLKRRLSEIAQNTDLRDPVEPVPAMVPKILYAEEEEATP
jgi:hypothetical protein